MALLRKRVKETEIEIMSRQEWEKKKLTEMATKSVSLIGMVAVTCNTAMVHVTQTMVQVMMMTMVQVMMTTIVMVQVTQAIVIVQVMMMAMVQVTMTIVMV
jgi:hypothetical protein